MQFSKLMLRSVWGFIVIAILVGCGSNDFTVITHFKNTDALPEGTSVYFEDQMIGEVINVKSEEGGSIAELKLDKQAVSKVSANAAVVLNRMKQGSPLEIHNRSNPSEELLQSGQTIRGFDSMFQFGAWMVGDAIQIGSGTATQYIESFQDYLQSDKFDQDKEAVKQEFNAYKDSAKEAMQQLEQDLQIVAQEFELTEQTAAQVVEELGKELAPMVREINKESAALVSEIEKFVQGLEQTDPQRRQAGQRLLESMIATLESLNQAMTENGDLEQEDSSTESTEPDY
jgi:ABC-type transporter Mla subunit MlaD